MYYMYEKPIVTQRSVSHEKWDYALYGTHVDVYRLIYMRKSFLRIVVCLRKSGTINDRAHV